MTPEASEVPVVEVNQESEQEQAADNKEAQAEEPC